MRKNQLITSFAFVLFVFTGFYVISTSSYVRFWVDDFCSAAFLRDNGYWQAQILWWKNWTGRFSYIAFLDFFELFGPNIVRVLPPLQYLLILLIGFPYSLLSIFFLINSPNVIQSFYWMTGSLNYFAPFIFLNMFLFLLFRKTGKHHRFFAFTILFIATGFNESFGVATILLLIFLLTFLKDLRKRNLILFGLAAVIASLVFMRLAPGNSVRSSTVSHPGNVVDLITDTFYYSRWYLIHLFYIKTFVLSLLVLISGFFIFLNKDRKYLLNPKRVILLSIIFCILITLSVVGLTYYAMNFEPPERVMSVVNNMIIYLAVIGSVALFDIYKNKIPQILPKLVFFLACILLIININSDWRKVKNEIGDYAITWDKAEKDIINFDADDSVDVNYIKAVGKLDGLTENGGWVAGCIASYYKIGKIVVK